VKVIVTTSPAQYGPAGERVGLLSTTSPHVTNGKTGDISGTGTGASREANGSTQDSHHSSPAEKTIPFLLLVKRILP
jgi:hypothetical protein